MVERMPAEPGILAFLATQRVALPKKIGETRRSPRSNLGVMLTVHVPRRRGSHGHHVVYPDRIGTWRRADWPFRRYAGGIHRADRRRERHRVAAVPALRGQGVCRKA